MPKLENWSIVVFPDPYTPPECCECILVGTVYNHPKHKDGNLLQTTAIKSFDAATHKAQTRRTLYDLGEPSPDFLQWLKDNGHKLEDYNKKEE